MAASAALVSYWGVVGPGYNWLIAAVVTVVGGATAAAAGSALGVAAATAALVAGVLAKRRNAATLLFAVSGLGFLLVSFDDSGVAAAVTGTILLGGMTGEMMLGHWFLVDPKLPRWALRRLDLVAAAGLALDLGVTASLGGFGSGDTVLLATMIALTIMTALLIAAVWFSLREQGYSGVMAATGLSYLGLLTTFGVVVVGRLLIEGQ